MNSLNSTPKSLRLHIGLFGKTNSGKSSFLNFITGQDISIVSKIEGTTTDVVEKSMELLPLGPVTFHDTAGYNDKTELSDYRLAKTEKVFTRTDINVIIVEYSKWGKFEEYIVEKSKINKTPVIVVFNKIDLYENIEKIPANELNVDRVIFVSSIDNTKKDFYLGEFKGSLIETVPDDFINPPPLVGDLVRPGGIAVLIVPIDLQAPKGRLILPQVQSIRDILDNDATSIVVKEREFPFLLENLKVDPDVVICDSQVVNKMVADTPRHIPATTFSILFARLKGELTELAKGAAYIDKLKKGSKVLIAEACTHHSAEDDIGTVKIPRWLRQFVGASIDIDVIHGRDYPENLSEYDIVIHCGSCMLNRRETLSRINRAIETGTYITNYGMCISYTQGVLDRVLKPFPSAYTEYMKIKNM